MSGASPNTPCVNSFKYRDITYNTCTLKNAPEGKPWCSTKVDESGGHIGREGNWGNCGSDCPMPGDTVDVSSGNIRRFIGTREIIRLDLTMQPLI